MTTVDVIDQMAKQSVANGSGPLCYWSWQSLPPPKGFGDGGSNSWGSRGSYNFAAMEKVWTGSVEAIRDLCTFAVARLQAHVDPVTKTGVNVLAAVTEGTEFATFLCDQGLHRDKEEHPERCALGAPIYNQSWRLRWPMSVTMWKFDGTNKEMVTKIMKDWRANPNEHMQNIMSTAPPPGMDSCTPCKACEQCCSQDGFKPDGSCAECLQCTACFDAVCNSTKRDIPTGGGSDGGKIPYNGTGWGPGGGVVGKALPCNAIPEHFMYPKAFPQDTSPLPASSTGDKTYLDAALDYWSNTPGWSLPESRCMSKIQSTCSGAKETSLRACQKCGLEHIIGLKLAGCSTDDVEFFCTTV